MPNGTLADSAGNAVLDTNGQPIQLSPTDTQITIAGDGTVSSENGQLGKIGVVHADRSDAAHRRGQHAVPLRRRRPRRSTSPGLVQGAIEDSNVQPVLEMTRMMDGERQFQFISQFIQAESRPAAVGDRQAAAAAAELRRTVRMRSLDIAGTGMQAQQTNVEVISNNIANMTTTGFKRRRAEFQDLIYQNLRRVGSNSSDTGTIVPSGAQVGLGVQDRGDLPHQRAGQPAADLQHAGHGDPGQRLLPGDAALRRHRLYARRHVRPGSRRHDRHRRRLHRAARHADPVERHRRHGERRRARCRSRMQGQTAPQTVGPAAARGVPQRGRTGCAGRQPVPADRRLRPAGDRQSRHRPASAR